MDSECKAHGVELPISLLANDDTLIDDTIVGLVATTAYKKCLTVAGEEHNPNDDNKAVIKKWEAKNPGKQFHEPFDIQFHDKGYNDESVDEFDRLDVLEHLCETNEEREVVASLKAGFYDGEDDGDGGEEIRRSLGMRYDTYMKSLDTKKLGNSEDKFMLAPFRKSKHSTLRKVMQLAQTQAAHTLWPSTGQKPMTLCLRRLRKT